jgi:ABC-2 type transport system ATP-binding protein
MFLSSHVLSEVQRTADRVVVLRAGGVVVEGTVEELRGRTRQRLEVWFDGGSHPSSNGSSTISWPACSALARDRLPPELTRA